MKKGKRKKVSSFVNNLCCRVFRLKASSWHIWRRFQRWRTRFISNPCCITFALWWLRTSLRARTSTLRLAPLHALQRYNVLKHILRSFKRWNKDMWSGKTSVDFFIFNVRWISTSCRRIYVRWSDAAKPPGTTWRSSPSTRWSPS